MTHGRPIISALSNKPVSVVPTPRITYVTNIKVTTNAARITDVRAEEPIDAIRSGRKTTDGIDLKKFKTPRVANSPERLRAIKTPMVVAHIVPMMKLSTDSQRVNSKLLQKLVVANKEIKSGITRHKCGKYFAPARNDADSHKPKLMIRVSSLFICLRGLTMSGNLLEVI